VPPADATVLDVQLLVNKAQSGGAAYSTFVDMVYVTPAPGRF